MAGGENGDTEMTEEELVEHVRGAYLRVREIWTPVP